METGTKYSIGALILIILVGSLTILLPSSNVQIKIDKDKATFYVNESGRFLISGVEESRLIKGSTTQGRRTSDVMIYNITEDNLVVIVRETPYSNGANIVEKWAFDPTNEDITKFPVYHTIEVYNAKDMFYRYSVRKLSDSGEKRKLPIDATEISFGKNMKITFPLGYNWAWVGYPYTESFSVQYKLNSDYEKFNIRLFDPPIKADNRLVINYG